jgi:hypothetical protein
MANSRTIRIVFVGFLGLLTIAAVFLILQRIETHLRLRQLYCEASGIYPYFHNSDASARAIHEIASYQGDEAENILFMLASKDSEIPGLNVQVEAINELQARRDPHISEFIAGLLKTQTLIDTRKAAAKALMHLPCDRVCVMELLRYLEQIDQGSLNCEDTVQPYSDPVLNKKVKQAVVAEQKEVYGELYTALLNQSKTTNIVLIEVYGLGSAAPKNFSIDFAVQSNDRDACAALEESVRISEHSAEGTSNDTRTRMKHAGEALKCSR